MFTPRVELMRIVKISEDQLEEHVLLENDATEHQSLTLSEGNWQ